MTKRRTRIAWIIATLVLMGVGLVVWGNWPKIMVQYYKYQLISVLETKDSKKLGPIIDGLANQGEAALPICLTWIEGEDPLLADASRYVLGRMGEKAVTSVKRLLLSGEERTKLRALKAVDCLGTDSIAYSRVGRSSLSSAFTTKKGWENYGMRCMPEILLLLDDPSKEVQWRAARILNKHSVPSDHQAKIDAILKEAEKQQ